ncbi:hypothetical protein JCM10212_001706 [Sporobolomyces blumeae]
MALKLPPEVLHRIAEYAQLDPDNVSLSALALVSRAFGSAVRSYRSTHLVVRSTTAVRRIQHRRAKNTGAVRSITIERGTRTRREPAKVGRRKHNSDDDAAVTADDLVKLCSLDSGIVELHLREVAFSTLRRRQVGFASSLGNLRSLSISGRVDGDEGGFHLHTVGQIVGAIPTLRHLALRHVRVAPSSLAGLAPPLLLRLTSFALHSTPVPSPAQLSWLLDASTRAESLRSLAFDLRDGTRPSQLYPVFWSTLTVRTLSLTSDLEGSIESMPSHFPSLERYEFRSNRRIDPHLLVKNARRFRRLRHLSDRSIAPGSGLDLWQLAEALLLHRRRVRIQVVAIERTRSGEPGFGALDEVCRFLRIDLRLVDLSSSELARGEPWISDESV